MSSEDANIMFSSAPLKLFFSSDTACSIAGKRPVPNEIWVSIKKSNVSCVLASVINPAMLCHLEIDPIGRAGL
jgi:hypothetical protein